jgi:hypothetical protein
MGFSRGPGRPSAPPRPPRAHVFAVGQRVYVASSVGGSAHVTLTDDAGQIAVASLGDGVEVAILAWRPGWGGNTRYRVRATDTGVEGWLAVGSLRRTAIAPPLVARPAAPPADDFHDAGHRFGQRRN